MSKTQRTLVDFGDVSGSESDESDRRDGGETQPPVRRPQWEPEPLQCECGTELSVWHETAAERRRLVRIYGDEDDGTVPACPECVEHARPDSQRIESVAHSVRDMDTEATAEKHDRREIIRKKVARNE